MREIKIAYDRSFLTARIGESELLGIFEPRLPLSAADPEAAVRAALAAPIGSPPLAELARGKQTAVIIASDHTRPVPSRVLMPALLAELRKGAPALDVTILMATGFHRATTRAELVAKFGEAIVATENIVVHDCADDAAMVELGTLPSGGKLAINRRAAECDLLLSEGFIEPHFFAGFSGGRKSVLPGVAARETVLANHCAEFIMNEHARTGVIDGNPIHADMIFAARAARLAFILNVVIDDDKRIVRAFAGDCDAAHRAGCEFMRRLAEIRVPRADIVLTGNGGYPLDQNLYQAVKGMTAGEAVTRRGGVIIMVAGCRDGHGGDSFYRHLCHAASPEALLAEVAKVPRGQTAPDQWEYQILARIMARHPVIVVTRDCEHALLHAAGLGAAHSIDDALQQARMLTGAGAKIAVIPNGVAVIPTVAEPA